MALGPRVTFSKVTRKNKKTLSQQARTHLVGGLRIEYHYVRKQKEMTELLTDTLVRLQKK